MSRCLCIRPGPPVPQLLREGISESRAKALVDSYTPMINKGLGKSSLSDTAAGMNAARNSC